MCRWLAYSGDPVLIEDLLFRPAHSLVDQSLQARMGHHHWSGGPPLGAVSSSKQADGIGHHPNRVESSHSGVPHVITGRSTGESTISADQISAAGAVCGEGQSLGARGPLSGSDHRVSVVQVGVLVVVSVMLGVPVPVVQVVQVVVVGDGAVAAAVAVDEVVLGGIMRPMLAGDHHSVLFRLRRR